MGPIGPWGPWYPLGKHLPSTCRAPAEVPAEAPVEAPVETSTQAPVETETATQPLDILTDEGKFNEAWKESLPDDLGKHSIWSKYDNVTDLVKGAINAQSQVGKKAEEFWFSEDEKDIARRKEIMNIPTMLFLVLFH